MFKDRESFYKSAKWQKLRNIIISERLDKNGVLYCAKCNNPIIHKGDIIAHHIKELDDENINDYNISLNPDNIELIHAQCHNKEHNRFGARNEKKVIFVWGCMCAGKTTHVRSVATKDDLIIDIDRLFNAISINDMYIKPISLLPTALQLRGCLFDIVKHRCGDWRYAYVISSAATEIERDRLIKLVGADESVYIEASKEECLKRAEGRPKYFYKLIEEWWEKYKPPHSKDE